MKWRDRQRKEREDWERVLREESPKLPTCLAPAHEWNFAAPGYVGQSKTEAEAKETVEEIVYGPDDKPWEGGVGNVPADPLNGLRFQTDEWVTRVNDQNGRLLAEKAVEVVDDALDLLAEGPPPEELKHPRFVRMVGVKSENPKNAN